MRHANYRIYKETGSLVIIEDLGPWDKHPTVTNDAEDVVRELASYVGSRRLFYYDSERNLDELVIRGGRFAGFVHGAAIAGLK